MPQKNIPLREIERAISINCAIDKHSKKTLQLAKWQGLNDQGLGRCIFLFIAIDAGYSQEEICDYLSMTEQEFLQKAGILDEFYSNGRLLFETIGHTASYQDTKDTYLFFYRKLVLAQNYLKFRCG